MLAAGHAPLPVGSAGSESVQRAPVSRVRHAPAPVELASRRRKPPSPPNPVSAEPFPGFCGDVVWAAQPGPSRATAPRRLSAASPSGSEDAHGIPKGACPLGGGHGARSPMRDAAPFGGLSRRKGQAALRSRRKHAGNPWREGVQRSGQSGSARAGLSQPRCRGELGARKGRSRRLRPLRAPGVGRYAMDSANEPSLLMWCLSRALPALTTIMSMPSKRTGTSPSGV